MIEHSGNPDKFNAAQWVDQWIETPNPALGGIRPSALMDTVAGQALVSSVLSKMLSGAYA
ncbi:MbcA/ParS/Xre antitoxin family protein [Pandoraea terrae]|nr:MbcA/ParS/Xre antitoxin family protein [Pandoraea terrae]